MTLVRSEEDITGPVGQQFGSDEVRFHAEGREDMDVRMLGQGRPFVLEVRNARRKGQTDLAGSLGA